MGKRIWSFLMRLCRGCLTAVLKCFHTELPDERWDVLEQFIKFACVGCSNSVVLLAVYYAVVLLFGKDTYMAGQTLGYICGILNSYFWNSRFVFASEKGKSWAAFVKMCVCYLLTYAVQIGILYAGVEMLHISEMIVPVIAILITTPLNFLLNKRFVF